MLQFTRAIFQTLLRICNLEYYFKMHRTLFFILFITVIKFHNDNILNYFVGPNYLQISHDKNSISFLYWTVVYMIFLQIDECCLLYKILSRFWVCVVLITVYKLFFFTNLNKKNIPLEIIACHWNRLWFSNEIIWIFVWLQVTHSNTFRIFKENGMESDRKISVDKLSNTWLRHNIYISL